MNLSLYFVNSTFANLEHLNRDGWILMGKVTAVSSIVLNTLSVYLIVTKSKKELVSYRIALVAAQILLCLAQFLFGFLLCIVPLFPFPAFIFYGVLADSVDILQLVEVWIILTISFLWALYATLVIRFRMVVRLNSFFNFSTTTYWITSIVLYVACIIIIVIMFELLRTSEEETATFLSWKYPKYSTIFQNYSLLVFSDKRTLHISAFSCMALAIIMVTCYVCLSVSIFIEVRHKVTSMNSSIQKYHLKVLKDIIIQIVIKLVTFAFYPILVVSLYFVPPEADIIKLTMVLYNIFVAAPIPGTLVLIVQTPAYRKFVIKLFSSVTRIEPFFIFNQRSSSYSVQPQEQKSSRR